MEETTKPDLEAGDEDRISKLPDDLIYRVLSRLNMKSAAQTSILSNTWRYMWTDRTDLDFDPLKIIPEYSMWEVPSEFMRSRYLQWVNQAVNAHRGPSIDRLRIFFPFGASYSSQIDAWVKFAISKRVKKLELDICSFVETVPLYRLGVNVLKDLPPFDSGIGFLTSLRLSGVGVSEEFLEFILLQCPLLEQLYVSGSKDLVGFKLMDSSSKCKLKRLGILGCLNLKIVEIHAVSLEYFAFHGVKETILELKCVPSLVGAAFGGQCCSTPNPPLRKFVCISKQLSVLTLDLKFGYTLLKGYVLSVPCFCNVKHLTMRVNDSPNSRVLEKLCSALACFIRACPALCELKIEVYWFIMCERKDKASEQLEIDGDALKPHRDELIGRMEETFPSLRVLELVGFLGCHLDVCILLFVALRAFNLNTIICDPRCYLREGYAAENPNRPSTKEAGRLRASKLAPALASLLPGLSFIIR